jgi:hypothetical protein
VFASMLTRAQTRMRAAESTLLVVLMVTASELSKFCAIPSADPLSNLATYVRTQSCLATIPWLLCHVVLHAQVDNMFPFDTK